MITLSISDAETLASLIALSNGDLHLLTIGITNSSTLARFIDIVRCLGPLESAVIKGKLMSVVKVLESSIFAFSAASRNLCIAILSFLKSIPLCFLKSSAI